MPSSESCESDDTLHSQQLYRDFDCPALRLALSSTGETELPSFSSGLHICPDAGASKRHCCTRPHLGKRIFGAARRTLARFGLRQRRSVNFQSASPTSTECSSRSSTQQFVTHDSKSIMELQGELVSEADSGMSWGLLTREIDHAPQELPTEFSNKHNFPHKPISTLKSSVPTTGLSPHFAPSGISALFSPVFQTSISSLDTTSSGVHCSELASETQDPSSQTTSGDLHELGDERDGADYIRYLSDNAEHAPAQEAAGEEQNFPIWEMNTEGGRADFCESPTSISSEMEFRKIRLQINTCTATVGPFAESRVLASGQASRSSNNYTLESPVDLSLYRQSCQGIFEFQSQGLELSSPSNQDSVSSESSSCDRSASIHDCLYLQALTLLHGPSLSELLDILHSESGKLSGWVPSGLLKRIEIVFQVTTKNFLGKLSELKEAEFCAVLEPVYGIKPTLGTGLSALNSLTTGQVPNRLNEVISLLFVAHSIVTMLVDEQNQARFIEALFLDDIEWMKAIACRQEQDTFEVLLQYVWPSAPISSIRTHGYGFSSPARESFRPTRTPLERASIPFKEGRLDGETEGGFRLRTGLNAQICQWYIDCEFRLRFSPNAALT